MNNFTKILVIYVGLFLNFRIIKLEVDQETLKRRVEDPLVGNDVFANDEDGSNNKIMLWNRFIHIHLFI